MKTDSDLKRDVLSELLWDPLVSDTKVGVTVNEGVVTLTGHLDTYAEKVAAKRAAERVSGVKVAVEKGWVTLMGDLDWNFQRRAVERMVRQLKGVVGITDNIKLKTLPVPLKLRERIQDALTRQAMRDARRIDVIVEGSEVTLRGQVHSWAERNAAEGASWSAPGVVS